MNLTQARLAERANSPAQPVPDQGTVSLRTISSIEKRYAPGEPWIGFSPSTIEALAIALDLEPNSPAWDEFTGASLLASHEQDPSTAQSPANRLAEPLFIEAGREKHLSRLEHAIDATVTGRSGVLFIGADPGTGKTSLIAHAARRAVERHSTLTVLWGDCTSREVVADPYQPFRQAFDALSGNLDAANPHHLVSGQNRARLTDRLPLALAAIAAEGRSLVNRFIPAVNLEAQRDNPAIDHALATRLDTMANAPASALEIHDLHEQAFRTLARYAETGPTILVLEDLHWADTGSATLIFHLVRRLHEHHVPLLVIGSYRPLDLDRNDPDDRAPFQQILRESTRFFVDPIVDLSDAVGGDAGRAYVDAMVESRFDAYPGDFRDVLFNLTNGLPLFVGAIIRWCQAERLVSGVDDDTPWEPDFSRLPTEIEALFANLINRLPGHLQSMLDIASVQGATFSAEVLQQAAGLTRTQMIQQLSRELIHRYHVVSQSGRYTMAGIPGHNYQFLHALLRDYLYHRMTDLEREHHHAATATAMVALYGEEASDASARIAFHFDRAADRLSAGRHFLLAGNHALDFYDYTRARSMFQRVQDLDMMALDPFPPSQALVGIGNCARGEGDVELARRSFARAIDLAHRHNLPLVQANAFTSLGMLDFDAGDMRQGAARLAQAVDALFAFGDLPEACRALSLLSLTLHGFGHYDEAARRASQALRMARELNDDTLIAGALIALGNCHLDTGQFSTATALYRECLGVSEDMGNTHRASICLLNLSLCHLETGHWEKAREALGRVIDNGANVHPRLLGAAEFNAALADELTGAFSQARGHYRESLRIREKTGQAALIIDSRAGLLRIALAENRRHDIAILLDWISTAIDDRGVDGVEHLSRLYVTLARAWNAVGQPALARQAALNGQAMLDERAALIADPAIRRSYLEHVASNQLIRDVSTCLAAKPATPPAAPW